MMKKTNIFTIAKLKSCCGFQITLFLFVLSLAPIIVRAQADELEIPAEVQEFIEPEGN